MQVIDQKQLESLFAAESEREMIALWLRLLKLMSWKICATQLTINS